MKGRNLLVKSKTEGVIVWPPYHAEATETSASDYNPSHFTGDGGGYRSIKIQTISNKFAFSSYNLLLLYFDELK